MKIIYHDVHMSCTSSLHGHVINELVKIGREEGGGKEKDFMTVQISTKYPRS